MDKAEVEDGNEADESEKEGFAEGEHCGKLELLLARGQTNCFLSAKAEGAAERLIQLNDMSTSTKPMMMQPAKNLANADTLERHTEVHKCLFPET